jgi:hypothetical protein
MGTRSSFRQAPNLNCSAKTRSTRWHSPHRRSREGVSSSEQQRSCTESAASPTSHGLRPWRREFCVTSFESSRSFTHDSKLRPWRREFCVMSLESRRSFTHDSKLCPWRCEFCVTSFESRRSFTHDSKLRTQNCHYAEAREPEFLCPVFSASQSRVLHSRVSAAPAC